MSIFKIFGTRGCRFLTMSKFRICDISQYVFSLSNVSGAFLYIFQSVFHFFPNFGNVGSTFHMRLDVENESWNFHEQVNISRHTRFWFKISKMWLSLFH